MAINDHSKLLQFSLSLHFANIFKNLLFYINLQKVTNMSQICKKYWNRVTSKDKNKSKSILFVSDV